MSTTVLQPAIQSKTAKPPRLSSERRRWIALAVLCLGQLMMVLDATIVNVALPSIQNDLHFSQGNLTWVLNGYLITFGGFLLPFRLEQFFGQALAQRLGIGLGLARMVFHAVEEFGGLVDQVQRGLAKILFVGTGEPENVLPFPARRSIPIIPDILAELLIASVRHVRAAFY